MTVTLPVLPLAPELAGSSAHNSCVPDTPKFNNIDPKMHFIKSKVLKNSVFFIFFSR